MNRLEAICSLIPACGTIADIGCDHGKVSAFVLKNGLAKRLVVNDISEASLQKARDLLTTVSDNTEIAFVCCDGAELEQNLDCAVIAGMGGREVLKILCAVLPQCAILAPQNYTAELRVALARLPYRVDFDKTVADSGKFYDIMRIQKSADNTDYVPDACAMQYGFDYKEKNPALLARLERDKQNLILYKQTAGNIKKLEIIKEVLRWQR